MASAVQEILGLKQIVFKRRLMKITFVVGEHKV